MIKRQIIYYIVTFFVCGLVISVSDNRSGIFWLAVIIGILVEGLLNLFPQIEQRKYL